MTNEQMLKLAAKAANYEVVFAPTGVAYMEWQPWNPIESDGDALRLAVDCRLFESFEFFQMLSAAQSDDAAEESTRDAIVRAAAELGSRSNALLSRKAADTAGKNETT